MKTAKLLAWVDLDPETGRYAISAYGNLVEGISNRSAAVILMDNPVLVSIEMPCSDDQYIPAPPVPVVATVKETK